MSANDANAANNRETIIRLDGQIKGLLAAVATEVLRSIVEGSELTGAPGQPVDTGALRASWQLAFPTPSSAVIGTNLEYAEPIEDGVGKYGPLTLRSSVGGFHSVKLTIANADRIVVAETTRLRAPHA